MKDTPYFRQVQLLIWVLPLIAEQPDFALKGGTAINLFVRDMPRLSVDIDLTYLPLESREVSVKNIANGMKTLSSRIRTVISEAKVTASGESSLIVATRNARIKIEPNLTLRGSVFASSPRELCAAAQGMFSAYVEVDTLSFADLYGGKICAALDRQHPRDLFDVKALLENEGLSDEVRQAFLVYLISHSRPIHEILNPSLLDCKEAFEREFQGMTRIPVTYGELCEARSSLIATLRRDLTEVERRFLLSVKKGEPDWSLHSVPDIQKLPGVQWKVQNVRKMDKKRNTEQLEKLRECLGL